MEGINLGEQVTRESHYIPKQKKGDFLGGAPEQVALRNTKVPPPTGEKKSQRVRGKEKQ